MIVAKNILRYLERNTNYDLFFSKQRSMIVTMFVYIDSGQCLDIKRPIFGIVHKLGEASMNWSSNQQSIVFFNTIEVKYRLIINTI